MNEVRRATAPALEVKGLDVYYGHSQALQGVNLTLENGVCTAARVGLGAVAPTVLLVEDAAKALIGSRLDEKALNAAAAACSAACRPIDDKRGTIAYRTKVAGVLLTRAVAIAARRAGGN